jgi:multiple RNA-binding domain-containing protein 1
LFLDPESLLMTSTYRFGNVAAFLLPPSKTVALVEYIEPTEARGAFKGLAYRKYMHLPLYLEWAPLGVVADKDKAAAASKKRGGRVETSAVAPAPAPAAAADGSSVEVPGKGSKPASGGEASAGSSTEEANNNDYSTLFIKNLSFSTTEEDLRKHIISLGLQQLRLVSIPKKSAKGQSQASLSMGFGFAEFRNSASANDALHRLEGSLLQGHALQIKPSDKRLSVSSAAVSSAVRSASAASAATTNANNKSSKLVVRNVAFQATTEELRALFQAYGTLKSLRIPRKLGGQHRGFAFVEFASPSEAAAAMLALEKTHFYGRHLILEWAAQDEEQQSMSELRKRAQVQEAVLHKRQKKNGSAGEGEDEVVDMSDDMY